jgi:hypothetical protein
MRNIQLSAIIGAEIVHYASEHSPSIRTLVGRWVVLIAF